MSEIVAPRGSPLSFAVVSCEDLGASRSFYCERIGFDAAPVELWQGPQFESLWQLPPGTRAQAQLLSACGCPVGRILLVEFDADALPPGMARERIQRRSDSLVIGLANLNFYAADARAATQQLRAQGYEFWSDPTQYDLTTDVGQPIEVVFDGPDGVAINLVELVSRDPATRIGQMRAYVEKHGRTARGFTPVVTTSHVCRSIVTARDFYEHVLGMGVLIDERLTAAHVNTFLRLPQGARTHITFMQGNHMFGKIALSEPLNYRHRCVELIERAHAPNVGYLAQAFEVADLDAALRASADCGAPLVVPRCRGRIPGIGARDYCVVRNPGSGALQWIIGPYSR
jgi:catechol 2,3-dioxygenase-like lactoylglutathione lyase family enzyme